MEQGSPESREAQREYAISLARDLSEANFRDSKMPQVKRKMTELMELVMQLEGRKVAKQIGEDGVVRFYAGNTEKRHLDGSHMHYLEYAVKSDDGREQAKLASFVDTDGGSMLMQKDIPSRHDRTWATDDAYTEDLKSLGTGYYHPDLPVLINRFRELRLAARMIQLILGAKEEEIAPTASEGEQVAGVAKEVLKDVGDITEK